MARQYIRKSKYSREYLTPFVSDAVSWSDLIRRLGLKVSGGTFAQITVAVKLAGLSTDHFAGHGWNRGMTAGSNGSVAAYTKKNSLPDDVLFSTNSGCSSKRLRVRLLARGRPYVCAECGLAAVWRGSSLTLHLDHVNGDRMDGREENLRFLCPNCHQQTPTWGRTGK